MNRIRLTESWLRREISKCIRNVLMESTSGMGVDANGNKTFDDENGYYEHPAISQWDDANRERGVVNQKKQGNGHNSSFDSPGRLMFNDEGEFMGLTESKLHKIIKESMKKVLNEMDLGSETTNVPYEVWSQFLGGKEPLFEFEDGIVYVDYDENSGTLCSGHLTNVGFHKDGEVEVPVEDGNFQAALEEVYSQLSANHEEMY